MKEVGLISLLECRSCSSEASLKSHAVDLGFVEAKFPR